MRNSYAAATMTLCVVVMFAGVLQVLRLARGCQTTLWAHVSMHRHYTWHCGISVTALWGWTVLV